VAAISVVVSGACFLAFAGVCGFALGGLGMTGLVLEIFGILNFNLGTLV
jgi:hypothetical protein